MQLNLFPFALALSTLWPETTHKVHQTIAELSRGLGAHTHIYHVFSANNVDWNFDLRSLNSTNIVLTRAPGSALRRHFNSQTLSVVLLGNFTIPKQLATLQRALQRWHHTDLLFVATTTPTLIAPWQRLFAWCWQHGFHNVLLTDLRGALLTFDPFQRLQLKRTDIAEYLAGRNRWRNFHGYSFRVFAGDKPPRVLVYRNASGSYVVTGVIPKTLQLFAALYNGTLSLSAFRRDPANYLKIECLRDMARGRVDICADIVCMSHKYAISQPLCIIPINMAVPYAQPIERFRNFLAPFEPGLWLLLLCAVIYVTLLTALIHRRQRGEYQLGRHFLLAVRSVIYAALDLRLLPGWRGRLVFVVLLLSGFVISNLYLELLSSMLSADQYERQLHTNDDVLATNQPIMVNAEYFQYWDKLLYSSNFPINAFNYHIAPAEELKQHRNSLDPTFGYVAAADILRYFLYQQQYLLHPRLKLLNEPVLMCLGGIPMPPNWPFEVMFNDFLGRTFELGFHEHFLEETKVEALRAGLLQFLRAKHEAVFSLNLNYFQMPAMLLGGGYLLALIVFIVELIVAK